MARILVTEELAPRGLDLMRAAGHEVDVRLNLSPDDLLAAVAGAAALIIRSATTVTAEVLAAGTDLVVVGRAGIGLDNVDVASATSRGVMVVNAPQSNVVSAAEQAMALLLAQARNIPQAHAALKAGKWERSRWEGVELHGKTLGVVGLGRVGALVAQRCLAFGMRLVAYDPFVAPERARHMGVTLMSLEDVVREADFLTVHLPKTPETVGLINADLLKLAKPSLRIVNTARGGIVVEDDLAEAVRTGVIQGAALDVFAKEPTTESPLFALDSVVVTPHLGASTTEAQDKAGFTIAEQVLLALAGDFVPFSVNVSAAEASVTVRPYLPLAERLGRLLASVAADESGPIDVVYEGALADYDTRILTLSALKGFLGAGTGEAVSYVNAPQVAQAAGVEVREQRLATGSEYTNLITLRRGAAGIAGTLVRGDARLVMVDDHAIDVPPSRHMLLVRNDDRPGMVGVVGTVLGRAGVNIADMALGRSPAGAAALMVIAHDAAVPPGVVDELAAQPGITRVVAVVD